MTKFLSKTMILVGLLSLPITLFTGVASHASPTATCSGLFLSSQVPITTWDALPTARKPYWNDVYLDALFSHPKVIQLRSRFGDGAGLKLSVEYAADKEVTGWSIQAGLLSDFLHTIFPKAEFQDWARERNNPDVFAFRPVDQLLSSGQPNGLGRGIDMTLLKAINPGPRRFRKNDLRQHMNLPQDALIASLYNGKGTGFKATGFAIESLFNNAEVNVVLFSDQSSGGVEGAKASLRSGLKDKKIKILMSSELAKMAPLVFEKDMKYVVVNESRGRLPYVHAAADLALILANGNTFESLNQRVPTYVLKSKELNKISDNPAPEGWDKVVGLSQKAGAHVVTLENLATVIKKTMKSTPTEPAYSKEVLPGETAMDVFLEQITNVLTKHP